MKLTKTKLKKFMLAEGVHPHMIKHLEGAGFFDKVISGIKNATKFIIKNKDTIAKVGKAGIEAYNNRHDLKGAFNKILENKEDLLKLGKAGLALYKGEEDGAGIVTGGKMHKKHVSHMREESRSPKKKSTGGKLTAGKMTAGKVHEVRRSRSEWVELVKNHYHAMKKRNPNYTYREALIDMSNKHKY